MKKTLGQPPSKTRAKTTRGNQVAEVQDKGIEARIQRGLALYRNGAVSQHGDLFVVRSASRSYTVSLAGDEPTCDCADFRTRLRTCKYGFATLVFAAKDRCKRRKRVDRRHKAEVDSLRGIGEQVSRDRMLSNLDQMRA
jgi:hypothetical protein